jgi:hypothetical protein
VVIEPILHAHDLFLFVAMVSFGYAPLQNDLYNQQFPVANFAIMRARTMNMHANLLAHLAGQDHALKALQQFRSALYLHALF